MKRKKTSPTRKRLTRALPSSDGGRRKHSAVLSQSDKSSAIQRGNSFREVRTSTLSPSIGDQEAHSTNSSKSGKPGIFRRSKWLRRSVYGLLGLIVLAVALVCAALVFMDPILKKVVEKRIRKETRLETSVGDLSTRLGTVQLSIRSLKIFNPKAFGGSALLDIPEFSFELDRDQARLRKLRFKQIRFHLREINVVKDKEGRLNLQELGKEFVDKIIKSGGKIHFQGGFEFAGIERLYITVGKLKYTDLLEPAKNEDLDLGVDNELVQNLRTEEELFQWYGAFCVRLFLQMVTQQMVNSPQHTQSFEKIVKQISKAVPLWSNGADESAFLPSATNGGKTVPLRSSP